MENHENRIDDRIENCMESISIENRKQLNEEQKSSLEDPITFSRNVYIFKEYVNQ